jgi:hypothetical protein
MRLGAEASVILAYVLFLNRATAWSHACLLAKPRYVARDSWSAAAHNTEAVSCCAITRMV